MCELSYSIFPCLDVPRYVYMHKQLKTDAAGIPHRSLDSYQHTSPRAQPAFKAPYNSFTSSGSLSPPRSSPPKPPRSYSSSSSYPRASSYNSPNSRVPLHTRENYESRSLDSSSSHYNKPGNNSSYYDNETVATISLRFTTGGVETPRRPPPPPPRPANSSGSHDPSGQEMDLYLNDQTRTQSSSTGVSFMVSRTSALDSQLGLHMGPYPSLVPSLPHH
jgi:hypothetical protein